MLSRRFFRDDVGEHPTDYWVFVHPNVDNLLLNP